MRIVIVILALALVLVGGWALTYPSSSDPKKRAELYAKMQETVANEAAFVELYYAPYIYAHQTKLGGWTPAEGRQRRRLPSQSFCSRRAGNMPYCSRCSAQ